MAGTRRAGRRCMKNLALLCFALSACAAETATTSSSEQDIIRDACPAGVPASLAPAADQDLSFTLDAVGVQIYHCTGTAWTLYAPDAQLYLPNNDNVSHGRH